MKPKDRNKAFEIYQPDRVKINGRHAFLSSININNNNSLKLSKSSYHTKSNSNYLNLNSKSNDDLLTSSTINKFNESNININNNKNENEEKFNNNNNDKKRRDGLNRSIKEFSFFDWSKVKLHDSNFRLAYSSLSPSLNLIHANNLSSDLPQVITIRFA